MNKKSSIKRRKRRVRAKIHGTKERPRFSVFRSNTHIYGQLINDDKGQTLVFASDKNIKTGSKIEKAKQVGLEIAGKAKTKKIKTVIFDRGSYAYHGRIKAVVDGAREGGLNF